VNWLATKRILVTGGAGFLGKYLVKKLEQRGCQQIFVPRSKDYNLVEMEAIKRLFEDVKPGIIIHLAAKVGGIETTRKRPGEFFYENLMMGIQLMEQARLFDIEKFVAIGTVCAYPKNISTPFKEEDLWSGYPEETNAPYGIAKKMTLVQSQAYHQQYGLNAIYLLPVNLYGPGDNFDPETSHAVPALIKKCFDAIESGAEEIVVWGTGTPTREYLYVEDAAEGIILATEQYDKPEPVNLGSAFEISVRELVELITKLTGFAGNIVWDTSKPDGQPRRLFDNSKAGKKFGFKAQISFEEGLRKTIDWYRERRTKGMIQ